ncbi:MAG: hypothetical protein O2931_01150 [Planctomycetota bacterium]|nr:hypothetical protein [Planctomycetota bacterium]MDA1177379.1 hypothetical protein [Planctomycetota bacterium]
MVCLSTACTQLATAEIDLKPRQPTLAAHSSSADRAWTSAKSIQDSYDGLDWRSPDGSDHQTTDVRRIDHNEASIATDLFTATTEAIDQPTMATVQRPTEKRTTAQSSAFRESVSSASHSFTPLQRSIARTDSRSTGDLSALPLPPDPAVMRSLAQQRREVPTTENRPRDYRIAAALESIAVELTVDQPSLPFDQPQSATLAALQQTESTQSVNAKSDALPTRSVLVVPGNRTTLSDTPDLDQQGSSETNELEAPQELEETNETQELNDADESINLSDTHDLPPELPQSSPDSSDPELMAQENLLRDRATDGIEEIEPSSDAESCRQGAKACRSAWEQLQESKVSEINLDTTPPFEPSEKDRSVANRKKLEKLSNTESRPWRDRRGHVLAEGQLQDFRFGKVSLRTADGTIQQIAQTELSDEDTCFLASIWNFPEGCRFGDSDFQPRNWHLLTMTWTASAVCHKPLYFEDVSLERYGHTFGPVRQTFLSGAHFFGNVVMLPYNVGLHSPTECQYTLGYYRPGSCAPWLLHALPISTRAIRYQASSILGVSAFLP